MNAVIGLVIISIIFGLLCLINSVAANALFSLFVASNYVAWGVPIVCRLIWGKQRFQPGEFYTGVMSKPIAIVAVIWLMFGLLLSMFPSNGPNPSRKLPVPCICAIFIYANLKSQRDELHHRPEWLRLACQYDLLRALCSQVVHRSEDNGADGQQ